MRAMILILLSIIQTALVSYGLYLIYSAQRAMDRLGIENQELWREYNSESGVVIVSAAFVWVVTIITLLISRQWSSWLEKLSIALAPLFFFMGWCVLWFI
jgi:cell division protein FtsW (lipid II flippase)